LSASSVRISTYGDCSIGQFHHQIPTLSWEGVVRLYIDRVIEGVDRCITHVLCGWELPWQHPSTSMLCLYYATTADIPTTTH